MRLFVGIPIPSEIKKEIIVLQKGLQSSGADLSVVSENNLHFTLKFLGEIDEKNGKNIEESRKTIGKIIEEIELILKKISKKYKPFNVHLHGVGSFPSMGSNSINFPSSNFSSSKSVPSAKSSAKFIRVVWIGIKENAESVAENATKNTVKNNTKNIAEKTESATNTTSATNAANITNSANAAFTNLIKDVRQNLEHIKKEEYKELKIHLTVARVRSARSIGKLIKIIEKWKDKGFGCFTADKIILYKSKFTGNGVEYIALKKIVLGGR